MTLTHATMSEDERSYRLQFMKALGHATTHSMNHTFALKAQANASDVEGSHVASALCGAALDFVAALLTTSCGPQEASRILRCVADGVATGTHATDTHAGAFPIVVILRDDQIHTADANTSQGA